MGSKRERAREDLRLGIVRFRKLLEDARRLGGLVEDARDKLGGDFIFDRQYIVATVDEAVALAGQLAFHAYVLAPGRCDAIDRMHDAVRAGGRDLLTRPASPGPDAAAAPDGGDPDTRLPEFRLLADAIAWLDGPAPAGGGTVLDLADAVFDLATASLDDLCAADLDVDRRIAPGSCASGAVDVVDLGGGADPHDGPLTLLALGADPAGGGAPRDGTDAPRAWLAAVDGARLALVGGRDGVRRHLEAVLTGDPDADYLFVAVRGAEDAGATLPTAMAVRRTAWGRIAWMRGVRPRELEDGLAQLGRDLFGGP